MTLLDSLMAQAVRAAREPRQAAADIMALGVPSTAILPAFVLLCVLSVLLVLIAETVAPTILSLWSPFQLTALILVLYGSLAFASCRIGQWMDGNGTYWDALTLITLMLAIFLPIKAVHTVFLVISLPLAGLLSIALMFYSIWINVMLIAALHGFESLGKSFAVVILSWFAVFVVLSIFGPMIGIDLTEMVPNV